MENRHGRPNKKENRPTIWSPASKIRDREKPDCLGASPFEIAAGAKKKREGDGKDQVWGDDIGR